MEHYRLVIDVNHVHDRDFDKLKKALTHVAWHVGKRDTHPLDPAVGEIYRLVTGVGMEIDVKSQDDFNAVANQLIQAINSATASEHVISIRALWVKPADLPGDMSFEYRPDNACKACGNAEFELDPDGYCPRCPEIALNDWLRQTKGTFGGYG